MVDISYTLEGVPTLFFNDYKYNPFNVINFCKLYKLIFKY